MQFMNASNEGPWDSLADDIEAYYEQLVLMYWQPLRAFVLSRTGNLQDAEDIVQEAFTRVYLALERYSVVQRRTLKVRPWLYKITLNIYCNYASRSKMPLLMPMDISDIGEILEREDEQNELPELACERAENRQELEALIATLPSHYKTMVSLYFFSGMSHKEIADTLHHSVGTVKVYVHRGVRLLRKMWGEQSKDVG